MKSNTVVRTQPGRYTFIDELVEAFYDCCETLIDDHIEHESEQSIFMMFIVMYFTFHLKSKSVFHEHTKEERKECIRTLLKDTISDPQKRRVCIETFESKFRFLFEDTSLVAQSTSQKQISN